MTDRELLAVMGAILATAIEKKATSRSLFSDKPEEEEGDTDSEAIIDAAVALLDEADDRCDKKGKLLPEDG